MTMQTMPYLGHATTQPVISQPTISPSAMRNPSASRPATPGYQAIRQSGEQAGGTVPGSSTQGGQTYAQWQQQRGWQGSPAVATTAPAAPMQPAGNMTGNLAQPGQTSASITSTFGAPQLPFADPNLNQQTVNRQFEAALGTQGLQSLLNGMRPAGNGMAATASDQQLLEPFMTQQGTSGANVLSGVPYQQNLGNANALLNWQKGQSADVLGQFNNLAGLNEAQQNYGLNSLLASMDQNYGNLSNQLGLGTSLLGTVAGPGSILSNLIGGASGSMGGLLGGLLGGIG